MRAATAVAFISLCAVTFGGATYTNDFRVTPGFGDRFNQTVRITYTTDESDPENAAFESQFSYNNAFRYRWSQLRAHTSLFSITPGVATEFSFPNQSPFSVTVPRPGDGVRGVMTADICYSSGIATCEVGDHDQIFAHLPVLLNAILSSPSMHFWSLIGDNFYDADGSLTRRFWATLSLEAKSKLFLAAPGNYDFWSTGDPADVTTSNVPDSQFGNGYMQYFGLDTQAATSSGNAWNFSINPDTVTSDVTDVSSAAASPVKPSKHSKHHTGKKHRKGGLGATSGDDQPNQKYLASGDNFQFYTQIGNIGVISYSGAHHHHDITPFFHTACDWMAARASTVDWILVMGHWARDTKGASDKTYTPAMYAEAVTDHGCPKAKTRYFEGHHHCNMVVDSKAEGFLVGAFGKTSSDCSQFGIPYLDSTGGRLQVIYFPISKKMVPAPGDTPEDIALELKGATERYALLSSCVAAKPISECLNLEHDVWLNISKA